jgi:hypothetical protein
MILPASSAGKDLFAGSTPSPTQRAQQPASEGLYGKQCVNASIP